MSEENQSNEDILMKTVDSKIIENDLERNKKLDEEIKSINSKVDLKLSSMDNNEKPKEVTMKISEIIDHMGSCSDGSCGIHQSIKKSTDKSYMKGFVLGAKFGKQKRN